MTPALSVVIPVYQAGRTIGTTLESLRRQTFSDLEVVVVDDGSTDEGPDLVATLARSDPRFRLVRGGGRRGVAAALNLGLAHCDAELVARLDADDEAEPHRFAVQVALLREDPGLAVCGSQVRYQGRGRRAVIGRVPLTDAEIRAELADTMHSPFFHPAVTMRRSALEAVGGYREVFRNAEDYDLWLRIRHVGGLVNVEEPLTRYRVSPRGATLGRLREQRRYALLARASAEDPGRSLDELWHVLRTAENDAAVTSFVAKEQRAFATLLADLGHSGQALAHLVRVRGQVGAAALPGFIADRMRRRARSQFPPRT